MIWKVPLSIKLTRPSLPRILWPSFSHWMLGNGFPMTWQCSWAVEPGAKVWLAGPCRMMGGTRSEGAGGTGKSDYSFTSTWNAKWVKEKPKSTKHHIMFCHMSAGENILCQRLSGPHLSGPAPVQHANQWHRFLRQESVDPAVTLNGIQSRNSMYTYNLLHVKMSFQQTLTLRVTNLEKL